LGRSRRRCSMSSLSTHRHTIMWHTPAHNYVVCIDP
jgi:hypothetical protein